jgi:Uma2 family endonuclease
MADRMTSADTDSPALPRRMSFEEWVALPEDEPGELVDGFLVEEEVPGYLHEIVIAWLARILGNWGTARGALVAGSGAKFRVTPRRGRMPDLTVYLQGDQKPPKRGLITAPPSIVVEVVSPGARDQRRDRVEKLAEYAEFGVRWYWIVDPELRTFEIFERIPEGRYLHAIGVTEGIVDPVPGCDGLHIAVSELWEQIDRLEN